MSFNHDNNDNYNQGNNLYSGNNVCIDETQNLNPVGINKTERSVGFRKNSGRLDNNNTFRDY